MKNNNLGAKIRNDPNVFTATGLLRNLIRKDYYVETISGKFYKIMYYFNQNGRLYFNGKILNKISNFNFKFEDYNLSLNYTVNVRQTHLRKDVSTNLIKNRVMYVPDFKTKSSIFKANCGFVLKFVHKFPNTMDLDSYNHTLCTNRYLTLRIQRYLAQNLF